MKHPEHRRPACYPVLSLLVLVCLAGCAALDTPLKKTPWEEHRRQTENLQQWTASGKLALRSGESAESATMVWRQQDANTHLTLSGPLGVAATAIDSDGRELRIRRGDQEQVLDISSPDAVYRSTGWDLPLKALVHWVRGLPSPGSEPQAMQFDPDSGLLQTLRQDNWDIRYDAYEVFDSLALPTRIELSRGDTRVKVIFSRWQTGPA